MATSTDTTLEIDDTLSSQCIQQHTDKAEATELYLQELYQAECIIKISQDDVSAIQEFTELNSSCSANLTPFDIFNDSSNNYDVFTCSSRNKTNATGETQTDGEHIRCCLQDFICDALIAIPCIFASLFIQLFVFYCWIRRMCSNMTLMHRWDQIQNYRRIRKKICATLSALEEQGLTIQ